MIDKHEQVRCPWCGEDNELGVWNKETYSKCRTAEMKEEYTQLTEEKAFKRETNAYYLCPACNLWSRGSQLSIVNTSNKDLLSLGGESLFS